MKQKLVTDSLINGPIIANERLWLTADRERVVLEGDPEAAFLFAAKGHRIPRAEAERLGLVVKEGAEVEVPTTIGGLTINTGEEEPVTSAQQEEPKKEEEPGIDLVNLSYRELREMAKEAGLEAGGSKADLIERLSALSTGSEEEEKDPSTKAEEETESEEDAE